MTKMDNSTDAADMVKAEQRDMKSVVQQFHESIEDETKQIAAHNALTELKRIRNKQRKF